MMKRKQPLNETVNSVAKMSKLEDEAEVAITEKEKKYDRQLRLWGNHGQEALEKARICLINANAIGTETLKCLVLPGIGSFDIIDNKFITKEDVSNNFFVDLKSLGKSRAEVACQYIQEMNEDVRGEYHTQDPVEMIEKKLNFFQRFTIVIASGIPERVLLKLSEFLWNANIPLVLCESIGFFGYTRLVFQEHAVIESHPDSSLEDLRLDRPFEELENFMSSVDLQSMSKQEHSHTPYLVIIFKAVEEWMQKNGRWPSLYKEKKEIKELIAKGIRKRDEEFDEEEENFAEAINNVNNTLVQTKVPDSVKSVLDPSFVCPTKSKKFWLLARAVGKFVKRHDCLPLRGSIPDMFSDSERYIKLQNIYREKAMADASEVFCIVQELSTEENTGVLVTQEEVRHFCKNSHQLYVARGKPLEDEFKSENIKDNLVQYIENEEEYPNFKLYIVFRSLARFLDTHASYPGRNEEESSKDQYELKCIIQELCAEIGVSSEDTLLFVDEMSRCNFSEMHSISAVLGGLVAHEVIKVVTRQFVPVNNCIVYNGISHSTLTLKLP